MLSPSTLGLTHRRTALSGSTADQKAVLLKAKFDVLAQDKKALRKTVEKHRRKTANKDKKLLPNRRP